MEIYWKWTAHLSLPISDRVPDTASLPQLFGNTTYSQEYPPFHLLKNKNKKKKSILILKQTQ